MLAVLRAEFSARADRDGRHVDVEFPTAATPSVRTTCDVSDPLRS
jgi:hypothetical protein